MWSYEHIGRRVAVHTVAVVGQTEAVAVAGPTDFVVDKVAGRTAVGRTVVGAAVDSIDFAMLGLDTETLVIEGSQVTEEVGQAAAEEACCNLPALVDMEMRVRHMEQE